MLNIEGVNHIGIRVSDKQVAIDFYALLGFELVSDVGFENGHPVIMRHPSDVTLNLLGPATVADGSNILQDADDKFHRCVIVIQQDHFIQWRLLEFWFRRRLQYACIPSWLGRVFIFGPRRRQSDGREWFRLLHHVNVLR